MKERVESKTRCVDKAGNDYTVRLTNFSLEDEIRQRQIEDLARLQKTYNSQKPDVAAIVVVLLIIAGIIGLVALFK